MEQASDELIRLLTEEVAKYQSYLDDILPQAEAYQRDVERTRGIMKTYQDVLDIEAELFPPPPASAGKESK